MGNEVRLCDVAVFGTKPTTDETALSHSHIVSVSQAVFAFTLRVTASMQLCGCSLCTLLWISWDRMVRNCSNTSRRKSASWGASQAKATHPWKSPRSHLRVSRDQWPPGSQTLTFLLWEPDDGAKRAWSENQLCAPAKVLRPFGSMNGVTKGLWPGAPSPDQGAQLWPWFNQLPCLGLGGSQRFAPLRGRSPAPWTLHQVSWESGEALGI